MPDDKPTRTEHPQPGTPSARPEREMFTAPGDNSTQSPDAAGGYAPPRPTSGTRYVLGDEIARGGMGVIYRATDTAFGREVALKVLHDKFGPRSGAARRFVDEARITGQLQHPAIPPVHDIGTLPDGRPFLAMKLIKGQTLEDLLSLRTDLSADRGRFVAAFEAVCQAVAYAHAHDVIHRDLKPANVMVGSFGEVQVMDWGLAKVLTNGRESPDADPDETVGISAIQSSRDSDDQYTQAGSVLGTPSFMPPEQAIGAIDQIDTQSDVFGLGGILAAVLTGHPPFQGETAESTRQLAAKGKTQDCYARLDESGADPELVSLCKRCLAAEKHDRPADAGEVATAVAQLRAAADERARQAELNRVQVAEQRKRRKVQLMLVTAMVGLLVAVGFGVALAGLWQAAVEAKSTAESARDGEATARGEAEAAKVAAEKAQVEAEIARDGEKRTRERVAVVEYGRTVAVAHQEWREGNTAAALALLQGTRKELRGWEWNHVHHLCHSDLLTFTGHSRGKSARMLGKSSASFSPDGSRIVTAGDPFLKVWDTHTGACVCTNKGAWWSGDSVSFSSDGSRVVAWSWSDRNIHVLDAKTGEELKVFKTARLGNNVYGITSVSFNFDESRLLTGTLGGAIVWDAKSETILHELKKFDGNTLSNSATFSADGSRVVVGWNNGAIVVWDAVTGAELLTIQGRGWILSAKFSPDGTRIVSASSAKIATVWNATTGAELLTLRGHTNAVVSAAFSSDGSRIVTASTDGTARVWDARSGDELLALKGHTDEVVSAEFSSDGSRILTGSADATAKIWDARTGAEFLRLQTRYPFFSMAVSADGSRIVTGGGDKMGRVWDARTGAELFMLKIKTDIGALSSVAFSPDGTRIVTGSLNQMAKVWDARTGDELFTLKEKAYERTTVTYSPDGARILMGSYDSPPIVTERSKWTLKVFDAENGTCVLTLDVSPDYVRTAAFSHDGARIIAACGATMKVWDSKSGELIHTLKGHAGPIACLSCSADGLLMISGSDDRTAKVWDAKTGAELLTLEGHTDSVRSVSFSSDGSRIVTSAADKTAKVWEAKTGAELITLKGHTHNVVSALFTPDGTRIVTASEDGTCRIWDSRPFRDTRPPDLNLAPLPREVKRPDVRQP